MCRVMITMSNPPKSLMSWPKGQPIYYDKLVLGCEEKTLGRVLLTTKFFSNKATESLFTYLNTLLHRDTYHA